MIFKSEVFKSISLLSSGTVLAQVIPLIFAPWIARIYDAKSFGEFAAILGILNILSVVINGRYDLAIVLPKSKEEALNLMAGSWLIGLVISIVVFFAIIPFHASISEYFSVDFGYYESILVLLSILAISFWQPINYFFIREKYYLKMTYNKFLKSMVTVGFTILLGLFYTESRINGLVLGLVIGWLTLAVFSYYQGIGQLIEKYQITKQLMSSLLKRYRDYPKFNALPALMNSFATQLGFYVFVYFFSTEIAGHYSFSKQYLFVPLSILGLSLSQVYFQRITEKFRLRKSVFRELGVLFLFLFSLAICVCIVVVFYSHELFNFFFGVKWNLSAEISKPVRAGHQKQISQSVP